MTPTASLLKRANAVTVRDRRPRRPAPPAVFASAKGAWCLDVEGNRYVDLTASSGAVLLGHADPAVVKAVVDAVTSGAVGLADAVTVPLVEVAERLVDRYPAAERVAFFRTGSEATTAAVRLARVATGRRWILSAGYHGWHEWQLGIRGFRVDASHRVVHFGYQPDALEALLDAIGERVAGVIVSPEPAWVATETLVRMSDACRRVGVLFVLDEVITGLRYGPSGINGAGVPADVLTLAKGLANGHSIAAVAGRSDVLASYHDADLGGTYNREVAPLAAARAVLDATSSGAVHQHASTIGRAMQEGIIAALERAGVPTWSGGPPLMFDLVMGDDIYADAFFTAMFERGVHMDRTGTQFVTGAHGSHEVEAVAVAAEAAAVEVSKAYPEVPPIDERRLAAYAWDAFGGVAADDVDWPADIQRVLNEVEQASR